MRLRKFLQVDVFTGNAYLGNPLAVVQDGTDLDEAEMQRFASWTNLSETTFLLPPSKPNADYRVRIFTPGGELPFAGHPTLGSCFAWVQSGGQARMGTTIVQECSAGLIQIRQQAARLAFAAPPLRKSTPETELLRAIVKALGIDPAQMLSAQLLDNGPVWMGLLLDSPATVLNLRPDHLALLKLKHKVGVAGIYPPEQAPSSSPQLEVRAFAAPIGVMEDPVTGSLNASLAQWLIQSNHLPQQYVAAQGTCLNRQGRVHIERDLQGQVWVGGGVVGCISGAVLL